MHLDLPRLAREFRAIEFGGPIPSEDLDAFVERTGIPLLPQHREVLETLGSVSFDACGAEGSDVEEIYTLAVFGLAEIENLVDLLAVDHQMSGFVPFGREMSGQWILIDSESGEIHLLQRALPPPNILRLGDDVNDFLSKLKVITYD